MELYKREQELFKEHVKDVKYGRLTPRTVFCILVLNDGWEIYGVSSCKDIKTYDETKGKYIALKHALTKLSSKVDNIPILQ